MGIRSLGSLLKTVGFAEKNFSHQKNGNSENGRVGRLRREKFQKNKNPQKVRVRMYFLHCKYNVLSLCQSQEREKNLQSVIVFSNVFENFFIQETMFSAIFEKSASFRSRRFPKPRISAVFRRTKIICQKSLRSLPKTE